ncbi:hypothetical protein GJ744_005291 [Endocarpon pusillum]|uniref:Uncharacterized protein n=1 Tax=Endocarpon pusillum TaxID=364733 RepID=A0A8H7E7B8_9EURO|nr:hypothetical protein GJ744_005291 [Endocarpon pusillum]
MPSNRVMYFPQDSIRWECRALKASLPFPWHDPNAFNGHLRTFDIGQMAPSERRPAAQRPPAKRETSRSMVRSRPQVPPAAHSPSNRTCSQPSPA